MIKLFMHLSVLHFGTEILLVLRIVRVHVIGLDCIIDDQNR